MIQLIERENINIEKYDTCVEKSEQSRVFAYSWYLDIVSDNWCVLVFQDYEAVMPLPFRKKYGIKYVYPPFWLIELGVFSQGKNILNDFLNEAFKRFNIPDLGSHLQIIVSSFLS